MTRKFVYSLSTIVLLVAAGSVQADAFRQIVADDGTVCNDTQYGPTTAYSTTAVHVRSIASRRRVGYMKFDISALKTPGKMLSNVCLDLDSDGSGRVAIYGVIESQEKITVPFTQLTWSMAPGVPNNPLPPIDSPVTLDMADLVGPLAIVTIPAVNTRVTTDPNKAMDNFVNSDTNGSILFLLAPAAEGQSALIWSIRRNTTDCAYLVGQTVPAVTGGASNPVPADKATDVYRDGNLSWTPGTYGKTHNVYLGTNLNDVNSAAPGSPLEVGVNQDANAFDPGRLQIGQTYYWRVDEVNAPPTSSTIFKGSVWSFTVEPATYKVANITATASSFETGKGPENTINGSGMNASDQHSTDATTMWATSRTDTGPAWIQYAFDRLYKLTQMKVWNYNADTEGLLGFGLKDVTIKYSADNISWTTLGNFQFAQAPGTANYASNTTVNMGGIAAKYVRIEVKTGWGTFGQYGLSEVQFFQIPAFARTPTPASGTANVAPDVTLGWRSGRESALTKVYMGADGNALPLASQITGDSYAPANLSLGRTYYWRIDEVNNAATPSLWASDVWNFSTRQYNPVDDFESYNDTTNSIFDVWVDGFNTPTTNGSQVGYGTSANGTFGDTTIVHGGKQSMPFAYNNTATAVNSEATRTWDTPQDWTANSADTLTLFVRGQPTGFQQVASDHILMSGTGTDIYNAADQGRFVYKQLSGNGSIIARVDRLDNTNVWAKAGVMIRETLDAGSSWAYSLASTGSGVHFQARLTTGAGATSDTTLTNLPTSQTTAPIPMWVKVERIGNVFNAYYSTDGVTWTPNPWNPQTITMGANIYIGLAVTSHAAGVTTQAEFSSITTIGTVTGQWQSAALGIDQPVGNTSDQLYVTIKDANSKTKTVLAAADAVLSGTWLEWRIPFSSLTGISANRVKSMVIGVGDKTNPKRGKGLLYIDDIEVGHPAQ